MYRTKFFEAYDFVTSITDIIIDQYDFVVYETMQNFLLKDLRGEEDLNNEMHNWKQFFCFNIWVGYWHVSAEYPAQTFTQFIEDW